MTTLSRRLRKFFYLILINIVFIVYRMLSQETTLDEEILNKNK